MPFDLAIPLLELYPKNSETSIQKNPDVHQSWNTNPKEPLCTQMFTAAQFTIAECWMWPKCPSVNEWIKTLWYIYTMKYYTAERKKVPSILHNSMDETGDHYAKWNKPGDERNISYDLTYTWNLINKTNEEARYNQRHWNKEQTDSNQREGGGG